MQESLLRSISLLSSTLPPTPRSPLHQPPRPRPCSPRHRPHRLRLILLLHADSAATRASFRLGLPPRFRSLLRSHRCIVVLLWRREEEEREAAPRGSSPFSSRAARRPLPSSVAAMPEIARHCCTVRQRSPSEFCFSSVSVVV